MRAGKSNIEIVARADHAVTIRDVGPWSKFMTVTNDPEGVVAELWKLGLLKDHQRLFYYDSADQLDELLHQGGGFTGFKPGPASGPYGEDETC